MSNSPHGEQGHFFICNSDATINPLELDFLRSNVQEFATLVLKKFPPKCPIRFCPIAVGDVTP